ncbi:hydrolase_4 domain-containing protein, partial [Haematococcus lacustris]
MDFAVDDVEVAVQHLRGSGLVSTLGLWGRSMGAVTALMYSARDPSIAGVVVDSPFAKLTDLMMEIVEEQQLPIPRMLTQGALFVMRHSVSPVDLVASSFTPALFGHAKDDTFIRMHHSERLYEAYAGDKNFIKVDGDHNSRRPEFFYQSVAIFFHNTLKLDEMLEGGNPLATDTMAHADLTAEMEGLRPQQQWPRRSKDTRGPGSEDLEHFSRPGDRGGLAGVLTSSLAADSPTGLAADDEADLESSSQALLPNGHGGGEQEEDALLALALSLSLQEAARH